MAAAGESCRPRSSPDFVRRTYFDCIALMIVSTLNIQGKNAMKRVTLRVIATPFFLAAAYVYVYVHFLAPEPVDCNAFSFFSTLDFGCLVTSATWLVVCVLAVPGLALWAAAGEKKVAKVDVE